MQSTTNMLRRDLFLEFKLGFSVGLIFFFLLDWADTQEIWTRDHKKMKIKTLKKCEKSQMQITTEYSQSCMILLISGSLLKRG